MRSARDSAALPALGFPIRESTGQRLFNASPWLIAVVHALHRLLVPRHPPYALIILTVIASAGIAPDGTGDTHYFCLANCAVFKVRREAPPGSLAAVRTAAGTGPVSQNSAACTRLDGCGRRPTRRGRRHGGFQSGRRPRRLPPGGRHACRTRDGTTA